MPCYFIYDKYYYDKLKVNLKFEEIFEKTNILI